MILLGTFLLIGSFLSPVFQNFFLFLCLLTFQQLKYLSMDFFVFITLGVCCSSWMCNTFSLYSRKFSAIISSNTFLLFFSLSSFWYFNTYMLPYLMTAYIFFEVISFFFILFSLCSLYCIFIYLPSNSLIFFFCQINYCWDLQVIFFISAIAFFKSRISI